MQKIKRLVPVAALAGFVSLALGAQQPAPQPTPAAPQSTPAQPQASAAPPSGSPNAQAVPVPSTANAPEVANPQLRPVTGELEKKLDTKDAKAGDPVVVKTTENATISNGLVIPKGSRIMGHVTTVQPHSDTNKNSQVTLQFDQAELKGGQTVPIASVLENVAPAEINVHPTDTLNSQPSAPMSASGGTAGVPSATTAGSATAGASASAPTTASGTPSVSPGTENQAASAAPKAGTIVARQGNVAIQTTALPGILLATNAEGKPFSNASGALVGAQKNVHLDGGTEFVLAVADMRSKP